MRNYVVSSLFLVFALITGACAGRQVRSASVPAPRLAEIAEPAPVQAIAAETPIAAAPESVRETAPAAVAPQSETEAGLDAAVSEETVAAAPAPAIRKKARATKRVRSKSKSAPADEASGREAAVGSLVSAPPAPEPAVAAPAASNTPVASAPANDIASNALVPSIFVPDKTAVAISRAYWKNYLAAAVLAALFGALCGVFASWRRARRLKAIASKPYDHLPDGAILLQEIVGGLVVNTQVLLPNAPSTRSEPVSTPQEAKMDELERTWQAEGDAMTAQTERVDVPTHDKFDLTDTYEQGEPSPPPVRTPSPPPIPSLPPKAAPSVDEQFASGSGKIISSSDDVLTASGVAYAPDPPSEPAPPPETYPSVIYESESATASN